MILSYKGYQVKPSKQFTRLYTVVTEGRGGKVPTVLTSVFTSPQYAKQAIDAYLQSKPKAKESYQ